MLASPQIAAQARSEEESADEGATVGVRIRSRSRASLRTGSSRPVPSASLSARDALTRIHLSNSRRLGDSEAALASRRGSLVLCAAVSERRPPRPQAEAQEYERVFQ